MFDLSERSVSEGPCSSGLLMGAKAASEEKEGTDRDCSGDKVSSMRRLRRAELPDVHSVDVSSLIAMVDVSSLLAMLSVSGSRSWRGPVI